MKSKLMSSDDFEDLSTKVFHEKCYQAIISIRLFIDWHHVVCALPSKYQSWIKWQELDYMNYKSCMKNSLPLNFQYILYRIWRKKRVCNVRTTYKKLNIYHSINKTNWKNEWSPMYMFWSSFSSKQNSENRAHIKFKS